MVRTMFISMCTVLTLVSVLSAKELESQQWRFTQRDVYVNGNLDRLATTFLSESSGRVAVLSDALEEAIILEDESGTVLASDRSSFEAGDSAARVVTPAGFPTRSIGALTKTPDGTYIAKAGHDFIVVARHQSQDGPIDRTSFARDYPVWDALRAEYEPDVNAIARIAETREPVDVTIVFATWCGDSRYHVPRLLRAIDAAGNPSLNVHLVGIGTDFQSPLELIQRKRIINVPTVIVERGGIEIGRIVETPASENVELDLANILEGRPLEHPGRWSRNERVASGRYLLQHANGAKGEERWELFSTDENGWLAHSTIELGGTRREIWHRVDKARQTSFIEITDEDAQGLRRTRFWNHGDSLTAHSRSGHGGIIDQIVPMPGSCAFSTASMLTAGWQCLDEEGKIAEGNVLRYAVAMGHANGVGAIETVRIACAGPSLDDTRVADPDLVHLCVTGQDESRELWLEQRLSIPVRVSENDFEATLVELTFGGESKS